MKVVLRNVRYPRKWNKGTRLTLCDEDGVIWASINFTDGILSVDHLKGVYIRTHKMNGMGQLQLDGEPEKPFHCPHCDDYEEAWDPEKKQVVCKRCGRPYFEVPEPVMHLEKAVA